MQKGSLSVQTENIFPVIKRWLYSDKDIFVREIVSNAADAITKHKRLVSLSEAPDTGSEYGISVSIDRDARTITVSDNGVGMSADEVDKYINSIALSGALDFIKKYESENGDTSGKGIIGHFGLGFYSAFMVSDKVEIRTKSYTDAPAVSWECDESGKYEMSEGDREERGTDIIMHITNEESGYLDTGKFRSVLEKYCGFLPYPITLSDGGEPVVVNDTEPLWQKNPSDITPEQYSQFYKKVFSDFSDPLLYVHINADYPLNFRGILFFPKIKSFYEPVESKVKLFYNSVFVADNIKEVVPDFIPNLRGVLDCPELPLNVSRSYLQSDAYVRKVASHIVKKVADRLCALFNNDREGFEKIWDDIRPYIEYGCIRDGKFYDRVKDIMLLRKADGGYATVAECLDGKEGGTVYYAGEGDGLQLYVSMYKEKGINVLLLDSMMDMQFIQFLESKNDKLKFVRVDADLSALGEKAEDNAALASLFRNACGKEDLSVSFVSAEGGTPAFIKVGEETRRMADMLKMYSRSGEPSLPVGEELVVNLADGRVAQLSAALEKDGETDRLKEIAEYIYMSALALSRPLTPDEQRRFSELSGSILGLLLG